MRSERLVGWAAMALVAAALTKGFALLLLPLFARVHGRSFVLWAVFGLVYMGMPLSVFLPQFLHGMHQYLETVHVNAGLFNWVNMGLAHVTRRSHYAITEKLSDAAILGVVAWSVWRPTTSYADLLRRSFTVLAVTLLVIPTLFPWYLLWTLAFVPLLGRRPLYSFVLLSGLSALLYTFYISFMPIGGRRSPSMCRSICCWRGRSCRRTGPERYAPGFAGCCPPIRRSDWAASRGKPSDARDDLQHPGRVGDGRAVVH